jgi:hypothetical protein
MHIQVLANNFERLVRINCALKSESSNDNILTDANIRGSATSVTPSEFKTAMQQLRQTLYRPAYWRIKRAQRVRAGQPK